MLRLHFKNPQNSFRFIVKMDTLIQSIASLWKLALIVFLLVVVIVFRKELRVLLLHRTWKLRKGDAEFSVEPIPRERTTGSFEESQKMQEPDLKISQEEIEATEDWKPATPRELRYKMFDIYQTTNSLDAVKKAYDDLQKVESDSVSRLKNELIFLYISYMLGDSTAVDKIKGLTENDEVRYTAHLWLAKCYEAAGYFDKAAESYQAAAEGEEDESNRAPTIISAATCLFKDGQRERSYLLMGCEIEKAKHNDVLSNLYSTLGNLHDLAGDYDLSAIALEKAIELKPNDATLLFQAAYTYGRTDMLDSLSLMHYKKTTEFTSNAPGTFNNLGVIYDMLAMPGKAVESYKLAIQLKSTLSAANIANKYIDAGFFDEADNILEEATHSEKPHENVFGAISKLSSRKKTEEDIELDTVRVARQIQKFLLSFSERYFAVVSGAHQFEGTWISPDRYEIAIRQIKNEIQGHWTQNDRKFKFEGYTSNFAAKIKLYKMEYEIFSTKERGYSKDGEGYIYISPDIGKMYMVNFKDKKPSFQTLTKKA